MRGLSNDFGSRDVSSQREASQEKHCRDEIGSTGKMDDGARRDGRRKDLREENRAGHAGDGAKRVDGSLQLALGGRVHAAGHQRLHGGSRDAPEGDQRNHGEDHPAAAGESETRESKGAEE